MRTKMIAGNWKMNNDLNAAVELAKALAGVKIPAGRKVLVAPAFPVIKSVKDALGSSEIIVAAQNMHFESKGAFTGDVSASMLKSVGVTAVILGHSERRAIFHEDDAMINKKVQKAIAENLTAILCVGETLEEREAGKAESVVETQLKGGLAGVSADQLAKVVIAYEPVWAIGTGKTASPEDADAMHAHIRKVMTALYSAAAAEDMTILYGGSANEANIDALMKKPNIDGGLVGGASLVAEKFIRMINYQV